MPIIEYRLVAGRHAGDDVERLLRRSCEFFAQVLECPADRIRAFAHEVPADRACVGGTMVSDGAEEAPFFTFALLQGRSLEQRHRLLEGFTDLVVECLGSDRSRIRAGIMLVSPDDWAIAGVPASQARKDEVAARAGSGGQ